MALNAKEASGGGGMNIEPLDPGTYPARLVQVVDLGVQTQRPFQGQEKPPVQEILLTYEFVDEFMKDEEGEEQPDKPRWLSESMPLYNLASDRAKSTLRYNALDPSGTADGDFSRLLGTPVNVTVVQNPGKGKNVGRVFENITSISPMRSKDADKCPKLINEPLVFDLDEPDMEVYAKLPKWVQDKLQANLGFAGSKLQEYLGTGAPAKEASTEDAPSEDENPF